MVTLYVATHNITGLKYFGKTEKYHSKEDLQENYHGSGSYWKRHLKKHGDDVTMEIFYQSEDQKLITSLSLMYSRFWKITESKQYANLKDENGLDGNCVGFKHTTYSKDKMSSNNCWNNPDEELSNRHSKKTSEGMSKSKKYGSRLENQKYDCIIYDGSGNIVFDGNISMGEIQSRFGYKRVLHDMMYNGKVPTRGALKNWKIKQKDT